MLWAGGAVSYAFLGGPPAGNAWAAPSFLYLGAAILLHGAPRGERASLALAGALGWLAELAGVHSGFPFGRYEYTAVLAPSLFGVPLAIGCAWLILFGYVWRMLAWLRLRRALVPWAGAAWMALFDLQIEPLAAGPLNYWVWLGDGVYYGAPAANFAGWFGVSWILFFALARKTPSARPDAPWLGLSVVLFFGLIALANGAAGAVLAGLALCLLHGWAVLRRRGRRFVLGSH